VSANPCDAERTCEVLRFFLRHPHTSDSVEGIARWRLLDEVLFREVRETERILSELVALGFLDEITGPGVPRLFRLRSGEADRAAAYLRDRSGT
jgi:hypothetical protein